MTFYSARKYLMDNYPRSVIRDSVDTTLIRRNGLKVKTSAAEILEKLVAEEREAESWLISPPTATENNSGLENL